MEPYVAEVRNKVLVNGELHWQVSEMEVLPVSVYEDLEYLLYDNKCNASDIYLKIAALDVNSKQELLEFFNVWMLISDHWSIILPAELTDENVKEKYSKVYRGDKEIPETVEQYYAKLSEEFNGETVVGLLNPRIIYLLTANDVKRWYKHYEIFQNGINAESNL